MTELPTPPPRQRHDRSTPKVDSFGPELLAALLRGAVDGLKVPMPYSRAVKFRQRLYMLRKAMRLESHPKYHIVARVRASIKWDDSTPITVSSKQVPRPASKNAPVIVEIAPLDSEYSDVLRAAGLNIDATLPEGEPPTPLDSYLEDLGKGADK